MQLWPHRAPQGRLLRLLMGKAALEEGPGAGFPLPSPDPSDLGEAPVHLYAS